MAVSLVLLKAVCSVVVKVVSMAGKLGVSWAGCSVVMLAIE